MKTSSTPVWEGPVEAFWMVTNRCNLQCSFCMVESQPHPNVLLGELDRETHLRLAHEMLDGGIMRVVLTGGEPTLLPHLEQIVAVLAKGGVYVYLTTNGTLLTQERIGRLVKAGLHEGQVSLNGATSEINDVLMGRHTHPLILRGLRWMQEAGLRTQVKVTVTRANQHEMPELIERLLEFGVGRVSLSEVSPMGRSALGPDWARFKPDFAALAALDTLAQEYTRQGRRVSVSGVSLALRENHGVPAACSIGDDRRQVVLLLPDSSLLPCTVIWKSHLANRVTEHGWLGAYRRLPGLYGRFLAEEALPEICHRCQWLASCQGGCRAGAQQVYGTWRAPDPQCPLLPQSGATSWRQVIPLRVG